MTRAISDVQSMIRTLLGKDLKVIVVHNASGRGPNAEVRYSVRMEYAADSQEIRSKFGSFFVGGKDQRPEALKAVSVSNKITPGTQIRLMIMKLMAKRYRASNPEGQARVVGYESRPTIKITPPESSADRRVKVYTYIEAIKKLPTSFASSELRPIVAKARVHFKDKLRQTFVVLSDDMSLPSVQSSAAAAAQDPDGSSVVDSDGGEEDAPASNPASNSAGRKRARVTENAETASDRQRARR